MQTLADAEATQWCVDRGFEVCGTGSARRISAGPQGESFRFSTEGGVRLRVLLAHFLVSPISQVLESFEGGLLWLSRWDIGSDAVEAPGIYLARAIWAPASEKESILFLPQQFDDVDFVAAQAAVALPLLFEWDAHYIPAADPFVARISYGGFVDIFSEQASVLENLEQRCAAADVRVMTT